MPNSYSPDIVVSYPVSKTFSKHPSLFVCSDFMLQPLMCFCKGFGFFLSVTSPIFCQSKVGVHLVELFYKFWIQHGRDKLKSAMRTKGKFLFSQASHLPLGIHLVISVIGNIYFKSFAAWHSDTRTCRGWCNKNFVKCCRNFMTLHARFSSMVIYLYLFVCVHFQCFLLIVSQIGTVYYISTI